MSRIYIDTNVFSNLRANNQSKYQTLNKLLTERKSNLSIFFSMAHIRDKRKDLSDFKFLDFEFMESFVHDNYLAYHPLEKKTSFYLATPKMVFNDDQPEEEFSDPFAFLDETNDDPSLTRAISSIKDALSQPMNIDLSILENISEDQRKLLEAFLPINKPGATILDQMRSMMSFTEDLQKNGDKYKELRTMIDQGMNNGTITLNGNEDFNEALKNTVIKKTYLEFVKDSMHHTDKDNIPKYDFHIQVYSMLDALGISKDKITKKNTMANLYNDAYHSYFASYCDYFVTDDTSTIKKTKAVYDLLGISTNVTSVDEFIDLFPKNVSTEIDTITDFLKKLSIDIGRLERTNFYVTETTIINRLNENFLYLGFFDAFVEVITAHERKIILAKTNTHSLSQPGYSEIAQIIQRALHMFGADIEQKLHFNYRNMQGEVSDLTTRWWEMHGTTFHLGYHNEINNRYGLAIIFPPPIKESLMQRGINIWTSFRGYLKRLLNRIRCLLKGSKKPGPNAAQGK